MAAEAFDEPIARSDSPASHEQNAQQGKDTTIELRNQVIQNFSHRFRGCGNYSPERASRGKKKGASERSLVMEP